MLIYGHGDMLFEGPDQMSNEVESMTWDARLRYWDEEWLSQLLEEALRLKSKSKASPSTKKECGCA